MTKISKFANALAKKPVESMTVQQFIENVHGSLWEPLVEVVRIEKDKDKQQLLKKKLPAVTISGAFEAGRKDGDISDHSGYIGVDIDNLGDSVQDVKDLLIPDPYVASKFTSAGGYGLCVLVKINPKKHRESFEGLQQYFFSKYNIIIDPSGSNPSRLRYVSYDPDAYFNAGSKTFDLYPEKRKAADTKGIYFSGGDLDHVFAQIADRRSDITGGYQQWLSICFAIADHYGQGGLDRFVAVSQYSEKYDRDSCERHYAIALKRNVSKKVTIATLLYYAKQAGINIVSDKTRVAIDAAKMGRNGSGTVEGTMRALREFNPEVDSESVRAVIEQVFLDTKDIPLESLPLKIQLKKYWKQYQSGIWRNTISKRHYRDCVAVGNQSVSDIAEHASEIIGKDISREMILEIMSSSNVEDRNPLRRFLEGLPRPAIGGHIKKLCNSLHGEGNAEWINHIVTKWLVCCVSAAYGNPSEVVLVLKGKQGSGKSHFFLNLLPPSFAFKDELVVEGYLQRGQEQSNRTMMASRWIVLDDEFQSIRNLSEDGFKAVVSTKKFMLRLPYERITEEYHKLCSFAATTNEEKFLKDMTGNRRFAVVGCGDIDRDTYNAVDKLELWKEIYHIWLENPGCKFDSEDFDRINEDSEDYRDPTTEEEMCAKIFKVCAPDQGDFLSASEVLMRLESVNIGKKLSVEAVGKAMVKLGFDNNGGKARKRDGILKRGFWVTAV